MLTFISIPCISCILRQKIIIIINTSTDTIIDSTLHYGMWRWVICQEGTKVLYQIPLIPFLEWKFEQNWDEYYVMWGGKK